MNKYAEALNRIANVNPSYVSWDDICCLKELIEGITPKKTILTYNSVGDEAVSCSVCKQPIVNVWSKRDYHPNYCHCCGQALDWVNEYE